MATEAPSPSYTVFKSTEESRYTLGPVYIPDALDAHDEFATSSELQKALWDTVRTGDRQIMLQHSTKPAGEWVEVVTWPYPVRCQLDLPTVTSSGVSKAAREVTFPAGTPYMGVIWEPWAWEEVKAGKLRGYSMGGFAQRVEVDLAKSRDSEHDVQAKKTLLSILLKHQDHNQQSHGNWARDGASELPRRRMRGATWLDGGLGGGRLQTPGADADHPKPPKMQGDAASLAEAFGRAISRRNAEGRLPTNEPGLDWHERLSRAGFSEKHIQGFMGEHYVTPKSRSRKPLRIGSTLDLKMNDGRLVRDIQYHGHYGTDYHFYNPETKQNLVYDLREISLFKPHIEPRASADYVRSERERYWREAPFDTAMMKHKPGGQDHPQKRHGDRGGSAGGGSGDGTSEETGGGSGSTSTGEGESNGGKLRHPDLPADHPLNNDEIMAAADKVVALLDQTHRNAQALGHRSAETMDMYRRNGIWSPERQQLHDDLEEAYMAKYGKTAEAGREIVMMAGQGGSGKGYQVGRLDSMLRDPLGITGTNEDGDPTNMLVINPDHFKEIMMSPEFRDRVMPGGVIAAGLKPMELAELVHEESSHLADVVLARGIREGKKLFIDKTMASPGSVYKTVRKALAAARDEGYTIKAVLVKTPFEISSKQAMERWYKAKDTEEGGRFLRPRILLSGLDDSGKPAPWKTFMDRANEGLFDEAGILDSQAGELIPGRDGKMQPKGTFRWLDVKRTKLTLASIPHKKRTPEQYTTSRTPGGTAQTSEERAEALVKAARIHLVDIGMALHG